MATKDSVDVLHVDDDPDVLDLTATLLERADGIRVETATSAEAGLDLLGEEDFECIVSDYDMPGTDGLEFLTAVRERGCVLPFILFTGHGNEAVASEAISAGVSDYLQKGTGTGQYEVLANRIRNYAAQYRAEREVERAQRRYERVARVASDIVFEWDAERDRLDFSDEFAEQFGVDPPTDPDQRWWVEQIHPDDRADVLDHLDEILAAGEAEVHIEYRFDPGDGDYRYISEDRHHRYEDGELAGTVGAFRDVTARREREQRLGALHEASRELMTAGSVEAVVETVSRAAEEVLDLSLHAVYRRDGDVLVPVATTERATEVFDGVPALERGEALVWEVVGGDEPRVYTDLDDVEGLYNPDTPAGSEFHLPFGEFGVFIAGSTATADVAESEVRLAQVLLANAEAALQRVDGAT
jgi:PAS domain S-box-containing protein